MANIWLGKSRRSSVQIAAAILKLSHTKDTTKSELKDCVKMSNQQTQKYLRWLVELHLLNMVETGQNRYRYRSTQRGQNLVSVVGEIQQMLSGK